MGMITILRCHNRQVKMGWNPALHPERWKFS